MRKKLIAIDYGKARCGIAETDDLGLIASPLTTVETPQLFQFLQKYIADNQPDELIVGEPFDFEDNHNEIEKDIQLFLTKFSDLWPQIKIKRMDERYTSKMAFQAMIEGGLSKKQRRNKATIDKVSACIILQSYLETL